MRTRRLASFGSVSARNLYSIAAKDKGGKGWIGMCADDRFTYGTVHDLLARFTDVRNLDAVGYAFPTTHLSRNTIKTYSGILSNCAQPSTAAFLVHSNCAGAFYTLTNDSPLRRSLEEALWSKILHNAPVEDIMILSDIVKTRKREGDLSVDELKVFRFYKSIVSDMFTKGEEALRAENESYKNGLELPSESKKVYVEHLKRNAKRLLLDPDCKIAPERCLFFFYQHGNNVKYNTVDGFYGLANGEIEYIKTEKIEKDPFIHKDGMKLFDLPDRGKFVIEDRGTEVLHKLPELKVPVKKWVDMMISQERMKDGVGF